MTFVTHTCLPTVSKMLLQPGQHHPSPRITRGVNVFLVPHSRYVLRTVGASLALVSG